MVGRNGRRILDPAEVGQAVDRPPPRRRQQAPVWRPRRNPAASAAASARTASPGACATAAAARLTSGGFLDAVQREEQIARSLESLGWVLLETVAQHPRQARSTAERTAAVRRTSSRKTAVMVSAFVSRRNGETPDEHLVEHHAQAEEVRTRIDARRLAPARATCTPRFRSGQGRAPSRWRQSARRRVHLSQLRDAEVENLDAGRPRVMKRLAGLMSRCTIPCSCAAARPRAICRAHSTAFGTSEAGR